MAEGGANDGGGAPDAAARGWKHIDLDHAMQGLQLEEEEDPTLTWGDEDVQVNSRQGGKGDASSKLRDFPRPNSIRIPSLGDSLTEGRRVTCVAGGILSPSEFCLTFADGSPEKMDGFIEKMSDSYKLRHHPRRTEDWEPIWDEKKIPPGSIVACFNNSGRAREAHELVRAKVIQKIDCPGLWLEVFLIDIGEYAKVKLCHMYYLHRNFTLEPSFAIKCRLALSPYYNQHHERINMWASRTTAFMTELLQNGDRGRRLDVRWVRPVVHMGLNNEVEVIWEVSILKLDPPRRDIHEGRPVEQQLIERTHGRYVYGTNEEGPNCAYLRYCRRWIMDGEEYEL